MHIVIGYQVPTLAGLTHIPKIYPSLLDLSIVLVAEIHNPPFTQSVKDKGTLVQMGVGMIGASSLDSEERGIGILPRCSGVIDGHTASPQPGQRLRLAGPRGMNLTCEYQCGRQQTAVRNRLAQSVPQEARVIVHHREIEFRDTGPASCATVRIVEEQP